jgi:hypothetical protein
MKWAGHVASMGDSRGARRVLVRRPEEKRPLRRPSRRWEDTFKIFKEWDREAWTGLLCLRIGTGGGLLLMR